MGHMRRRKKLGMNEHMFKVWCVYGPESTWEANCKGARRLKLFATCVSEVRGQNRFQERSGFTSEENEGNAGKDGRARCAGISCARNGAVARVPDHKLLVIRDEERNGSKWSRNVQCWLEVNSSDAPNRSTTVLRHAMQGQMYERTRKLVGDRWTHLFHVGCCVADSRRKKPWAF